MDFTLPSYQIYLKRNILGILNEDNLLSMITLLNEKNLAINKNILYNSHVSIEDQQRLYPYINRTQYLSLPYQFNTSHDENETLINQCKYLLTPSMSPLLVPDERLMQLPTTLLFTTEFDILRDEGRRRISLELFSLSLSLLGYIFASRLKSLNKTIYHHHFPTAFHGAHVFLYGPLRFEIAHHMIEHTARVIQNYL